MAQTRRPAALSGDETRQDRRSLLGIAYAPIIWAFHFVTIYGLAAVACAKRPAALDDAIWWIGAATALAAVGILGVAVPSLREWLRERDLQTDHDSAEGRAHFLAHASLLLAGLSLFATLLQALPALIAPSCR